MSGAFPEHSPAGVNDAEEAELLSSSFCCHISGES
jgi:hypothetical protein